MKSLRNLFFSLCALFAFVVNSPAPTWGSYYGMPNSSDSPLFSGQGVPFGAVQSVQSNAYYFITSAAASGAPVYNSILVKTDQTNATFKYYITTNSYTIASNAALATNIFWLTSTNAGLATNDILVARDVANDGYQMTIVSGNATDAAGLVYTNASGQCAIKVFNTLTNGPNAGDILYQMRPILTLTPCQETRITTSLTTAPAPMYQWLQLNDLGINFPLNPAGPIGLPTMVLLNTSNATTSVGLFVSGQYFRRPRTF